METVLNLAGTREVFWDDYLIDTEKTTAVHRLHHPTETGDKFYANGPCRINSSGYISLVVEPDGLIRRYYCGTPREMKPGEKPTFGTTCVYYAESRDGVHWVKPNLGLFEVDGSYDNNMVFDGRNVIRPDGKEIAFDNFFVFRDTNPACPPEEKYKAILAMGAQLWCYIAADGIHFEAGWMISPRGRFDSLNTAMWDAERQIYHCYHRYFHTDSDGVPDNCRGICHMTSRDFREWSESVPLDYMSDEVYQMYTNSISVYQRAPQILVGFPVRYAGRREWTANYDRLGGAELRKNKMLLEPRMGLAVTENVFMFSRDGQKWVRYDEAFITPGAENGENWIYGDGYVAVGLLETPGPNGAATQLSLYKTGIEGQWREPVCTRCTIRKDGFVSLNAPYAGAVVTTKPFTFGGKGVALNFSTSAVGYLYVTLTAEDGTVARSCEIFGDSCDRIIDFDIDLSAFAGKKTVMEIRMRDADLYSVKFD